MSSEICEKRAKLRREAVSLAKQYEDVIFIGGLNHEQDSDCPDRRKSRGNGRVDPERRNSGVELVCRNRRGEEPWQR